MISDHDDSVNYQWQLHK